MTSWISGAHAYFAFCWGCWFQGYSGLLRVLLCSAMDAALSRRSRKGLDNYTIFSGALDLVSSS
ncbi:hypothetical protein METBIDRAFT_103077 [Metschnikowia bicuspidata var. bicuspidata NRRL YB-4993]|uniref:Uncharacterized protein n=1 Tax=Metschnikowia bicuspidata var. bicuspidata NRRL YB-4993 TaxID=869754 RepID=A0A1A0HGG5_9ASCO|nr:hypothetical protein METBIDRAFT_103077 [Metschnikowia bicuspidata var. bicuspidata NRRL YB-4993]OBA23259.1 hypothetical protein METBIDRAFT_103077 [Metschnikowia bicuspidata var. bicuspidata NRRL YB-4993]